MSEVDALPLAASAQHEKAYDGQQDTHPLVGIQSLSEDDERSQEHHHGTSGIDGTYEGEGQMLDAAIAESPTGEYDATLQYDKLLNLPSAKGCMESHGQED